MNNFNETTTRSIAEVDYFVNRIITGEDSKMQCAKALVPMIRALQKNAEITIEKGVKSFFPIMVIHVTKEFAKNVSRSQKLTQEDLSSIQRIFDALERLQEEPLSFESQYNKIFAKQANDYNTKTYCLQQILIKNRLSTPKLFNNYNHLSLIVTKLIDEWDDLCRRGFSLENTFYPFSQSVKYSKEKGKELSEEDKFQLFSDLLDGKAKIVPVYQKVVVGAEIIPVHDTADYVFDDKIIKNKYQIAESHKLESRKIK